MYYFDVYRKEIIEKPLLSGKEIIEILGIEPSPLVGKIKKALLEKQIEGVIRTKEQALEFVRNL